MNDVLIKDIARMDEIILNLENSVDKYSSEFILLDMFKSARDMIVRIGVSGGHYIEENLKCQ